MGVQSVAFSPDGLTLASGSRDGTILLWDLTPDTSVVEPHMVDVNQDGVVNILDLVMVAARFGKSGQNRFDVNSDGVVNIQDLVLIAAFIQNPTVAPPAGTRDSKTVVAGDVQDWLMDAKRIEHKDETSKRGIMMLEQLLTLLTEQQAAPITTALLPNYPNPFNPETWIPYQLAESAEVTLTIYGSNGERVKTLTLGNQPAGLYQSQSRAGYWDGRNENGETITNGIYFCTLTTGNFTATRKMLVSK